MSKTKLLLTVLSVILMCLTAQADVLKGRVLDAESGEPLEGAKVQMAIHAPGSHWWWMELSTDTLGIYTCEMNEMSQVNMDISYFGYESQKMRVNCDGGKDTLRLKDIHLKMSEELLKEVTVNGKAKRFFMKGDTVVFNPDAFNLEDGDRASKLLTKLPGVSVDGDKLTFMGKEIHFKINGHDATDEFLTAQLPAEAIANVKSYEQKSEKAELTGKNDGQEQQVLDITIKPGFLDKWYGQTTTSAYASKNYKVEANVHKLSDKEPMDIYLRASDNGSRTNGIWGEQVWDWGEDIPQRQQIGKMGYAHVWKGDSVKTSYDDKWGVWTTPSHNDQYQHSWNTQQTFLAGQDPTFKSSNGYNYNHNFEMPLNFISFLHLRPKLTFNATASVTFYRRESHSDDNQKTYRGETYTEVPDSLTNASTSQSSSESKGFQGYVSFNLDRYWEHSNLHVEGSANYTTEQGDSQSQSEYDYYDLGTHQTDLQTGHSPNRNTNTDLSVDYHHQLVPEKVELGLRYENVYAHQNERDERTRNGEIDTENSVSDKTTTLSNRARVELDADLDKLYMNLNFGLTHDHEQKDYQRGGLDTLAQRNYWSPDPAFYFTLKPRKGMELKGDVGWSRSMPSLISCLNYTDDTNPLYITQGNPLLRRSSDLSSSLLYNLMLTRGSQMISTRINFNRTYNPVGSLLYYNATTGGYRVTQTNMGNQDTWSLSLNYDRGLGQYFRFKNHVQTSYRQSYSMKTMTSETDPLEQSRQRTITVNERPELTFENAGWESTLFGSMNYRDVNYTDLDMQDLHLWDYTYGIRGEYKVKQWIFSATAKVVGNRGYLSESMNRDRVALDARVEWKCLKNKGSLSLSARDILNKMDQFSSSVTTTSRSESWQETFHRYLAVSFQYHFDAKGQKKDHDD